MTRECQGCPPKWVTNKWRNRWNPVSNLSLELAVVSPSSCEILPTPSPSPRAWRARPRGAPHSSGWCRCQRTPPPQTSAADTSRECRHWLLNTNCHLIKLNAVTLFLPTVVDSDANWPLVKLNDFTVVLRVGVDSDRNWPLGELNAVTFLSPAVADTDTNNFW